MLHARKIPSHISISKGLALSFASNRKDLKALAALYCLKGSLTCGRIKRFFAHRGTLAASFGISPRTLDAYVARLEEMGYVRKHYRYADAPTSYDLVLRASKTLAGESSTSKKIFYHVTYSSFSELLLKLKLIACEEREARHQWRIDNPENHDEYDKREQKRNRKIFSSKQLEGQKRFSAAQKIKHFTEVVASPEYVGKARVQSPYADISQEVLRHVFGYESKTTIGRLLKQAQAAGLITVKPRRIATTFDASLRNYAWLREEVFGNDYTYQRSGGVIYKILPSQIVFLPSIHN